MGTQYQSFPDARGASQSLAKLRALMLPCLEGKAFLDVGCNEGFFCAIARAAGASRVVGIDMRPEMLERARKRVPGAEFRRQSWDDPIEGRFDVIQFSSAIHYASDQPALIDKLMGLLNDGGVLVLELGIAQQDGDQYVGVQRNRGGVCQFATPATLRRVLDAYDVREIGPSVLQRGDPVPRFVLHIRRRPAAIADTSLDSPPARPLILFFDAASRFGKSSTVRLLQEGIPEERLRTVSIDGLLNRTDAEAAARHPAHAGIIGTIAGFRAQTSPRTDLVMQMLAERRLLDDFLAYAEATAAIGRAPVTVWDGFVPPETREVARLYFERRGYRVWYGAPRQRFQFPRVDVAALSAVPVQGAPDAREAALARLRLLQLPRLEERSFVEIGGDTPIGDLARAAGASSTLALAAPAALDGRFDLVVYAAAGGAPEAATLRELLGHVAADGLLAVELPSADASAPGRADGEFERYVAALRRDLPGVLVRKVTSGPARGAGAQVLHLQNARPVLVLVDDCLARESVSLLELLCTGSAPPPRVDLAALRACAAGGAELPRSPLLLAHGSLAAAERDRVLQGLEQAGYVVWELRRRLELPFVALDVEAALARAFPGARVAPTDVATTGEARAPESVSLWRRVRRIVRAAGKRLGLGGARVVPAPIAAPVSAAQVHPAPPGGVEGALLDVCIRGGHLRLAGWAVDTSRRCAATDFVVEIDGRRLGPVRAAARRRPRLVERFGLADDVRPGFQIDVPLVDAGGAEHVLALAAQGEARPRWVRVGCRAGGSVRWLRKPPALRVRKGGD